MTVRRHFSHRLLDPFEDESFTGPFLIGDDFNQSPSQGRYGNDFKKALSRFIE